jgi:hypothetical protein
MRNSFIPLFILLLFFGATVFLNIRQEMILHEADQSLVSIGYVEPTNSSDTRFFVRQAGEQERAVELRYHYQGQDVKSETITLVPKEERVITPPSDPTLQSITVRYTDTNNQETVLTLYKK